MELTRGATDRRTFRGPKALDAPVIAPGILTSIPVVGGGLCASFRKFAKAQIEVREGANPRVKRCTIRDGGANGVWVWKKAWGTFEDCNVFGNALSGVVVSDGGNPTVKNCKIHDGKDCGVLVRDTAWGTFEDCEIHRNAISGIDVREGGNPTVKGCTIRDGKVYGVYIYRGGNGTFQGNTLSGNAKGAWRITADAGAVQRLRNSPNQ